MQLLKYKRLMLILISLALIFALGVMTSIAQEKRIRDFFQTNVMPSVAQEKVKLKDTRYLFITRMEVMKIDDTEGHIMQIT